MKRIIFAVFLVYFSLPVTAKVKLPSFFTDNMVLQQKANANIWGWAEKNKAITVRTSWNRKLYKTTTSATGDWKIAVSTPSFGGPYQIEISDGEVTTLKNILIGEVWLCSGQSNMQLPLAGWGKINNYKQEIADANYPKIRLLQAEHVLSYVPLNDVKLNNGGAWQECSPNSIAEFSATAYFFAREIYKQTGIPIGLIHTSWGGTVVEAWTSSSALKTIPDFSKELQLIKEKSEGKTSNYESKLKVWKEDVIKTDRGFNNGKPAWANLNLNDADWKTMYAPLLWKGDDLVNFDGAVWMRKEVDLTQDMLGKDLKLSLGAIDDDDITYFNGVQVGATNGAGEKRTYTVNANLAKVGKNIITVRVFDSGGGGGLYGNAALLKLQATNGAPISLAGDWKYKIGFSLSEISLQPQSDTDPNQVTVLYNAMIHPFLNYTIKGVIWYQGESNENRAEQYRTLFPLMITDWRSKFKQGDFPFYFVQLANYMAKTTVPGESNWATIRDAQLKTLKLPNTGMATIIDIGEAEDIHPKNKQDVGKRLALIALHNDYNKKIEYSGPMLSGSKTDGNKIILTFTHAKGLQARGGGALKGFAITGADKIWHWAEATINGSDVIVTAGEVADPKFVRYDWANNPDGNLYNDSNLPASPFQTGK